MKEPFPHFLISSPERRSKMATVEERLAALEQANAALIAEVRELQQDRQAAEARATGLQRRLRWWKGAAALFLLVGLLFGYPQLGQAQGTVESRLATLETKLARVFVVNGGNDIVISGANLNIVNGGGNTQTANGLGNLILGYNEARGGGLDQRTGSHNLVLGQQNNYTSFGGIIGGYQNTIAGPFAHVLTGHQNGALSFYSCIATGFSNNAANTYAAVLGGALNVASGLVSCVSGGNDNDATGPTSSVSGGTANTASGSSSSVSGGESNIASGFQSSVSGGNSRSAVGMHDWWGGGAFQEN
jgi:hypothetical protein